MASKSDAKIDVSTSSSVVDALCASLQALSRRDLVRTINLVRGELSERLVDVERDVAAAAHFGKDALRAQLMEYREFYHRVQAFSDLVIALLQRGADEREIMPLIQCMTQTLTAGVSSNAPTVVLPSDPHSQLREQELKTALQLSRAYVAGFEFEDDQSKRIGERDELLQTIDKLVS